MKKIFVSAILLLTFILFSAQAASSNAESFESFAQRYFAEKRKGSGFSIQFLKTASKDSSKTEHLEKLAIYDLETDFTDFLIKNSSKSSYTAMKKTLITESDEGECSGLYELMSLVLSRRFVEFKEASENFQRSKEVDYINLLSLLFSSDFDGFKEKLSSYLSKYRDSNERSLLVRYSLMTEYVTDGELFFTHFKKDTAKTAILASIIAKKTPLMYETMLWQSKNDEAKGMKNTLKENPLFFAEMILIDFMRGELDKNDLKIFNSMHKDFPLNYFFEELK
ncbi:MAG: hypothetical protein PHW02_08935 [bacterium]|nr:hypothetical protein [bacterium]